MAISSVDTLPVASPTPPLTPTAAEKKSAYVPQDLSENGLARAELTEYQTSAAQQSGDDEEGLSFWDVLDVVNPLQHIPIVNTIYRELTGDKISSGAKLVGGGLFFGPIGLGFAALDVGVKEMTGAAIDEHVMAMINGEDAGENARQATAAEAAEKNSKQAKLDDPAQKGAQEATATAQAVPVGVVDRNAPLGLFSVPGTPQTPAPAGTQQVAAVAEASAPLGLIGSVPPVSVSTQAAAQKVAQEAGANTRTLESTRPRARLARGAQPSQDHLAMAMQAQGLETSKLMTVPSRSATALSAQMIAAEKQGQAQIQTASAPTQLVTAPPSGLSITTTQTPAQATVQSPVQAPVQASAAPTDGAPTGPVDVPAWFDSAMMKASAAYQKTNRITAAP